MPDDPLLAWMKANGVEATREKYIALAAKDGEWTSEDEASLPPELQDWSKYDLDADDEIVAT